jgi:alkylation response protein AidB-like acyl-CoA dehydrogenase
VAAADTPGAGADDAVGLDTGAGAAEARAELGAVARKLLGTSPAPSWRALAAAGWTGLEVPETLDGAGASFAETAVIVEELGRAASASAFLGPAVLGVGTLLALSPSPARDDLLRAAATGAAVPVAVLAGGSGREVPFRLERAADGRLRLRGSAAFVPDAAAADRLLLVAAGPDAPATSPAAPVPPCVVGVRPGTTGVHVEAQPVIDETRRLARVSADGAEVPEASVWRFTGDPAAAVASLRDRAAVAVACDSLGIAEAMLERTVAYVRMREQFGRPVGSFQAVQHACADMLVALRAGRELVGAAVSAIAVSPVGAGVPDAGTAASMAASYACGAAVDIAGSAMQLHGGIGYTWESGIHAYLKRAALNRSLFGSPAGHRARLAARYLSDESVMERKARS